MNRPWAALAAFCLVSGCGGAQAGALYALDCSETSVTSNGPPYDSELFGRHPETVVVDEKAKRLYYLSENINGPMLRDICSATTIPCPFTFTRSGGQSLQASEAGRFDFIYDRASLQFTAQETRRNKRTGKTRTFSQTWRCRNTGFPSNLWRNRPQP